MSKLPNAPLLEVVYELRWEVENISDSQKYQYLYGDLYNSLKDEYPIRESLYKMEIPMIVLLNNPVHRYRKTDNAYPLYQIGPGILAVNTINKIYVWEDYFTNCKKITNTFFTIFPAKEKTQFAPSLLYIDFFKINPKDENVIDFINNSLNINFTQKFYTTQNFPTQFELTLLYPCEIGQLEIKMHIGKKDGKIDGLIVQTKIIGEKQDSDEAKIIAWLDKAHQSLGSLFKEMTEGDLYNSFN